MASSASFTCRCCGCEHRSIQLEPGMQARCVRCDTRLARGARFGPDTALVFAVTGLILAVPSALHPMVSAGKLGMQRTSVLFTGVAHLWEAGMRALAILVLLCGWLLPVMLLAILAVVHGSLRFGWEVIDLRPLIRAALVLEQLAIPEVQVLAILVALMKLGNIVVVTLGPGFWCYCAMALSLIIAQNSSHLEASGPRPASSRARRFGTKGRVGFEIRRQASRAGRSGPSGYSNPSGLSGQADAISNR